MKKEKKDFQTTVRMPEAMWRDIEMIAGRQEISAVAWIRRACQEKLEREKDPAGAGVLPTDTDALRRMIREIVQEELDGRNRPA